jgi:hypothetical protein
VPLDEWSITSPPSGVNSILFPVTQMLPWVHPTGGLLDPANRQWDMSKKGV